jgi:RNase P/RNase MRP subunit POP5
MLRNLKPSLREKKRYLFLEGKFSKKEIEDVIKNYIGILGYSKACPIWIEKNILAVNRKELEKIRASLIFLKGVKIKRVSGTLKKLKIVKFK